MDDANGSLEFDAVSAEVIAQIVAACDGKPDPSSSFLRFTFRSLHVRIAPSDPVIEPVDAEVVDLTLTSLGVQIPCAVPVDEDVVVHATLPGLGDRRWRCRVVSCEAQSDGTCLATLAFRRAG